MPFRFRPFGAVGSVLEVLAGLWVLQPVLWTDEPYAGWPDVVVGVVGALLICVGVIGVTAALCRGLIARRRSETS